jgi:hypothetical protein
MHQTYMKYNNGKVTNGWSKELFWARNKGSRFGAVSTHNCMQSIKLRSFDQILDGIDLRSEW